MMFQAAPIDPGLQIGALLIGLAIAIILHEVAHGYVALRLGDPTAKYAGRLTLNPVKHFDLWGSLLVPLFFILASSVAGGGPILGWAKPVPVNYYNLRRGRYGPMIVALAGPLTNLVLLAVFGMFARFSPVGTSLPYLFGVIALVNGWLMMFNLLPIPPLDGSKILYVFLDRRPDVIQALERYGLFILLFLLFFGAGVLKLLFIPVVFLMTVFSGPEVLGIVFS